MVTGDACQGFQQCFHHLCLLGRVWMVPLLLLHQRALKAKTTCLGSTLCQLTASQLVAEACAAGSHNMGTLLPCKQKQGAALPHIDRMTSHGKNSIYSEHQA